MQPKDFLQKHLPIRTQEYPSDMNPLLSNQGFNTVGYFRTELEEALAAFPIYGGTTPTTTESPPATTAQDASDPPAQAPEATPGGDSAVGQPDSMTPEKVAELLKQVHDLTTQVSKLTSENNTYKSKENEATRAQQTREQQLEADLTESQQIIAKMDAVIRHTAIINAIQGMKDIEWHSARHVLNELNMDSFELDVDLDSGTATVTGIESDLKRIAKECPWLVSKDRAATPSGGQHSTTQIKPRGSGAPPAPPGGSNDKASKRAELISKYPVIAHGRNG